MKKKVVVIGGGLGGISAAIMLAQKGEFEVTLLEKNERLGGKLNILKKDGFSFDLGPSIFSLPQMFQPLFEQNGKTLQDYVPLRRLDPQWRNFFEDGTTFDIWEDFAKMKGELDKIDPPSDPNSVHSHQDYQRFLDYSKTQYHLINQGYFDKGIDTLWQFFKFYGLFGASKLDFWSSMSQGVGRYLKNPYLQAAFQYFIKYVGSSPDDAPGFMNLMPNIQLEFGLWYVDGGMYELAKGLEKRLRELNVRIELQTEVVEIEKQGKFVTGVRTAQNKQFKADFVVSNMEVVPAYKNLLKEEDRFMKKLSRFKPSCSGIVLHLGVKKKYPGLAHHNFFYSQNQKAHFHRVFHENKLPDDPTIYLVAPSVTDPTQAPAGCENIKILPHIPSIIEGAGGYTYEDCLVLKEKVLDKLERMGLPGLRENTIVEDFWTPFDIQRRYYSNAGSIYGVLTDKKVNFAFKAPKRSSQYKNLFFTGGSVNPGGGMPMVVLSGRHVAEMIQQAGE